VDFRFERIKMGITFSLAFSDTSLVLLTTIIVISLYTKYFSGYTPLVHPLLLQKQSDVSQTRKEGESAVYRNWATGHGTPVSLDKRLRRVVGRTANWSRKIRNV
jgi:hypothetical protein